MKNTITFFGLAFLFTFGLFSTVYSQTKPQIGWTQYRGFERSAKSAEKFNLKAGEMKAELVWKNNMGSGISEIVVSDESVYTLYSDKLDSLSGFEYIAAFNRNTGQEIWRSMIDSIYIENDGWGDGPRSTPVIDDTNIYSLSGNGNLSANAKKDGELIWQIDLVKEFGSLRPRWGFSTSPVIFDDKLIMEVGGTEGRAFVAFDRNNGSVLWAKGNGTTSYSSPLIALFDGQEQLLFANGNTLYSYNSKGDTLWTYKLPFRAPIAMPLLIEDNKLFFSNIASGFVIIKIENNKAVELLKGPDMKNDFMTSVYHEGYIYGYHIAALRCISAETGEVKWSKRGFGKGSLMMVDDKLIVLSDKGKMAIVETNPEAYTELISLQAVEGSIAWTSPSFYKGKVYVRNQNEIACYQFN